MRYDWKEENRFTKDKGLSDRAAERRKLLRQKQAVRNFEAMSSEELDKYAVEKLKTNFDGLKGANIGYKREAIKVIDELERKGNGNTIDGLTIKFGWTPKGVYTKYDDITNTILLPKSGSLTRFEESQKRANTRYHVRWHTDKDYYATETFSGTIWHEIGHAVDIKSGQKYSRWLSSDPDIETTSIKISAYSGSTQNVRVAKRSEAWAENFAAYMDGGKNKQKVDRRIAVMIQLA